MSKIDSDKFWSRVWIATICAVLLIAVAGWITDSTLARHRKASNPTITQSGYVRTFWRAPGRYGYNDPDTVIGFETDAGNVSTIRFEGIQGALWQGLHATIQYKLVIDSDDGSEVDFAGQKVYSLLSAQQLK